LLIFNDFVRAASKSLRKLLETCLVYEEKDLKDTSMVTEQYAFFAKINSRSIFKIEPSTECGLLVKEMFKILRVTKEKISFDALLACLTEQFPSCMNIKDFLIGSISFWHKAVACIEYLKREKIIKQEVAESFEKADLYFQKALQKIENLTAPSLSPIAAAY